MEKSITLFVTFLICSVSSLATALRNGQLRLVNQPDGEMCEGRLEIFSSDAFHQGWFTVCNDDFGKEELQVICRQLGCPSNEPTRVQISNYGSPPTYMKVLKQVCTGSEGRISQCAVSSTYSCDFVESDLIGVSCSSHSNVIQTLSVVTILLLAVLVCFIVN